MFRREDGVNLRNAALSRGWLETNVSSHGFRDIKGA